MSPTGVARLGLVLPKRLARHAVTRNLIRRQAREVFRSQAAMLPATDLVLRLTRSLKEVSLDCASQKKMFRAEIEALLKRINKPLEIGQLGAFLS